MSSRGSLLPKTSIQVIIGILYSAAIVAASIRTAIHLYIQRPLSLDDGLLVFAGLALTVSTIIIYKGLDIMFLAEEVVPMSISEEKAELAGLDAMADILWYQRVEYIYISMIWLAIFAVKFAFLSFFHHLVTRVRHLLIYWRVVTIINVIAFVVCILTGFIECPYTSLRTLTCGQSRGLHKSSALTGVAIGLDILTDFLIISILARILWQVKIKSRQKLGIGVFLSLSIFMTSIASVRISGYRAHGSYGYTWQAFWMEFEACVAVIMVSLTAFRSLFVTAESKASRSKFRPWYSSSVARLRKGRKNPVSGHNVEGLPAVPRATLTGMRTFIAGPHRHSEPETLGWDKLEEHKPLRNSD